MTDPAIQVVTGCRGHRIVQGGTKPNILIAGHTHKMVYIF